MGQHSRHPHAVALFAGLSALACAKQPGKTPESTAWIEGRVGSNAGRRVRVLAIPRDKTLPFASTYSDPSGEYKIGPVPPAEYDVYPSLEVRDEVSNYPGFSVSATAGNVARADFVAPGDGSITIRVPELSETGRLLLEVTLFEGAKEIGSPAHYDQQIRIKNGEHRSRISESSEMTATSFTGLTAGPYTACKKLNVDGEDLWVMCETLELENKEQLALDLA